MAAWRATVLVMLGCVLSCAAPAADPTDELPLTKPVNLKAMPTDISVSNLNRAMKRYNRELGVACSYCHVENRDTGKVDYISDENAKKETARIMITMLEDINDKYLAQLDGDVRYTADMGCGTCHQGRANPPPFESKAR